MIKTIKDLKELLAQNEGTLQIGMKTQNFGLAVTLICYNKKFLDLHPIGRNKFEFEFEYDATLEALEKEYYNRNLSVDALSFFEEMRLLKGRIHTYQTSTH